MSLKPWHVRGYLRSSPPVLGINTTSMSQPNQQQQLPQGHQSTPAASAQSSVIAQTEVVRSSDIGNLLQPQGSSSTQTAPPTTSSQQLPPSSSSPAQPSVNTVTNVTKDPPKAHTPSTTGPPPSTQQAGDVQSRPQPASAPALHPSSASLPQEQQQQQPQAPKALPTGTPASTPSHFTAASPQLHQAENIQNRPQIPPAPVYVSSRTKQQAFTGPPPAHPPKFPASGSSMPAGSSPSAAHSGMAPSVQPSTRPPLRLPSAPPSVSLMFNPGHGPPAPAAVDNNRSSTSSSSFNGPAVVRRQEASAPAKPEDVLYYKVTIPPSAVPGQPVCNNQICLRI